MLARICRIPGFRRLWRRFPLGAAGIRTEYDIWTRPEYAYGVYSAAGLARSLRLEGVTAIELGVAGGSGLVALEEAAAEIQAETGVKIDVIGFDAGSGMPEPVDYRDAPHVWGKGFYEMDEDRLRQRLKRGRLILGPVQQTIPRALQEGPISWPIGFVSFDLDYYSSTKRAFALFSGEAATRLPRILCYFDDTVWPERAYHNEWVGERRAIREYNQENELRKISKIHHLAWMRRFPALWNEEMYVHHDFEHPLYTRLVTPEGDAASQLPLR